MAKTSANPTSRGTTGRSPVSASRKSAQDSDVIIDPPQEEPAAAYQVATQKSALLTSGQVLSLQQSVGNQAVTHLLQRTPAEGQNSAGVRGFGQPALASPVVQLNPKKGKKKKTLSKHKVKDQKKTETTPANKTDGTTKTTASKTATLDDDSQVLHTDKGEAYCCEVGKSLRSPTDAKQAYDAKAAPHPKKFDLSVKGKKPDGSDGPKNWVNCDLAEEIEDDLSEMLKAASADGVEMHSRIGLRSLEGQWRVWHNGGHPPGHSYIASPGTSNHGTGRAIDFQAGFEWLLENAGAHGFVNLTTERWHYDHVSTPGIIQHHRKMINDSTKRKQVMGGKAKALTEEEKTALTSQYDEATAKYEALPYNQARAYPRETWLKIQELAGMPEKERTGTLDEATCKAVILWQRSKGEAEDGKVTPAMLKAMGIESNGTATAEKNVEPVATPTADKSIKPADTTKAVDKSVKSGASTTEEKVIKSGWSGTVDKSINAGLTIQGKGVRRIPLEGLSTVRATLAEDPTQAKNKQFTQGRAMVLVPANVNGIEPVEVLVHLHGMTMGYRTAVEKTTFGASVGHTEDLENDKIVQQVEGSGRRMIAAMPQGTDQASFDPKSGAFDSDAFIQEVMTQLATILKWPKPPSIERTVLSGFSGGGLTINRMGSGKGQPRAPSKLGELILFDAIHRDYKSVWNFLEGKLNEGLAAISGKPEKAQLNYLLHKGFRFRGITTGKSGYGWRYQYIADKLYARSGKEAPGWFPTHATDLGGEDSPVYKALAENYQVIISANTWHGTLMGDTKAKGVKGYLEQALSAGPSQ